MRCVCVGGGGVYSILYIYRIIKFTIFVIYVFFMKIVFYRVGHLLCSYIPYNENSLAQSICYAVDKKSVITNFKLKVKKGCN